MALYYFINMKKIICYLILIVVFVCSSCVTKNFDNSIYSSDFSNIISSSANTNTIQSSNNLDSSGYISNPQSNSSNKDSSCSQLSSISKETDYTYQFGEYYDELMSVMERDKYRIESSYTTVFATITMRDFVNVLTNLSSQ